MAHKTLVGGTAYDISGGKTLVGGTGYSISKGRTLVGGTGYDINFLIGITAVTLNYASSVTIGSSISPSISISPSNYSAYKSRTFSITSGTSYASIDSSTGKLTGKAAGYVTVKVTIVDALGNTVTATDTITVKEVTYTATIKSVVGGNASTLYNALIQVQSSSGSYLFNKAEYSYKDSVSGSTLSDSSTYTKSGITKGSTLFIGFYDLEDAEYAITLNGKRVGKYNGSYTNMTYSCSITGNFTITATSSGTGSSRKFTIAITM